MKINKKMLAGVGLGAVALVGGTFAYYNQTLSIDNPLKTAKYGNELIEEFTPPTEEVKPGATFTKEVGAVNTGNYPVMVRIRMDESWKRKETKDGENTVTEIISNSSNNYNTTFNIENFETVDGKTVWLATQVESKAGKADGAINGETEVDGKKDDTVVRKNLSSSEKWIYNENDGYWYYNAILAKETEGSNAHKTDNLLESITIASNIDLGHYVEKDYYYVGNDNTDKTTIADTDWNEYTVVKDENRNTTDIKVNEESVTDLNNDGIIDAIDLAKYLRLDSAKDKLFRKNVSLLDDKKQGYADANYTLTITSQFVQATPDALLEAFGTFDNLPEDIVTLIKGIDLDK